MLWRIIYSAPKMKYLQVPPRGMVAATSVAAKARATTVARMVLKGAIVEYSCEISSLREFVSRLWSNPLALYMLYGIHLHII